MTIDSHSYLVSRGWKGKGNALQEGGIARPVVQAQKKDQKGLGKNRDDGFQFWDHVYAVAADAIQIHVEDSEEDDENVISARESFSQDVATITGPPKQGKEMAMTRTGILSNRRPTELPSASMVVTISQQSGRTGGDLLVLAKREAAKRELYSRFYHGGVVNQEEATSVSDRGKEKCANPVADRDGNETAACVTLDLAVLDEKKRRKEEKRKRKEEKVASKKRKVEVEDERRPSMKRHRGSVGSS